MGPMQVVTAGASAFLLRVFLRKKKTDEEQVELEKQEFEGLPVVPTLIAAAVWSLVTWINLADKKERIRTRKEVEQASDLKSSKRSIAICTTASVPWLTGTAVNPAIRAIELTKLGHKVTLLLPWLIPKDQPIVFSGETLFQSPSEQAEYVKQWMNDLVDELDITNVTLPEVRFYAGGYAKDVGSVFPLSDIVMALPPNFERDLLILEEPEHLTWYYYGDRLPSQFRYVVGVIHTNYVEYAKNWDFPVGIVKSRLLWFYNKWCTRTHTHRIIKLSDAMQRFPREITRNVHGVRQKFLTIGKSLTPESFTHDLYFVGKLVWQKGYNRLIPLLKGYYKMTGEAVSMEWFGAGEDFEDILNTVQCEGALRNILLRGQAVDHASLTPYKALVNASDSEGLATVTLEAVAMGKFVVIPDHPCNEFFKRFDNAIFYRNQKQFNKALDFVRKNAPKQLAADDEKELSWDGGVERFIEACKTRATRGPVDRFAANALARIMPAVTSKVFEEDDYAEIMEEVKRDRRHKQYESTSRCFRIVS